MGMFSWLTDPINHAFGGHAGENIGDPAGKADATAAAALATQQAALKAQQDAVALAAAASVPASDSESAVAASENQKRKLQQGSSFGIGMQTALGAPPVGFRLLSGQ